MVCEACRFMHLVGDTWLFLVVSVSTCLPCVSVCCSVLQHTVIPCGVCINLSSLCLSVLQCVATYRYSLWCLYQPVFLVLPICKSLGLTATHCNTLRHGITVFLVLPICKSLGVLHTSRLLSWTPHVFYAAAPHPLSHDPPCLSFLSLFLLGTIM